jgi:hypothetical protein
VAKQTASFLPVGCLFCGDDVSSLALDNAASSSSVKNKQSEDGAAEVLAAKLCGVARAIHEHGPQPACRPALGVRSAPSS